MQVTNSHWEFLVTLRSAVRMLAPRSIHAYRILAGPLAGRIIVTSLHDYPAAVFGWTERPLLEWFRQNVNAGETWLDVGAHYGYTAIALAELVGAAGRVYAFEPSLTTAGHLNRTRTLNRLNQMTVVPLGLSDSPEIQQLSVPIDRGMANHSFGGSDYEQIYIVCFDHLRTNLRCGRVHGVKVDVQGMELPVLSGMKRTLRDDHPKLIVEFHPGVDRSQVLDLLHEVGYGMPGTAIDPGSKLTPPSYYDDRSYLFECQKHE